jgi:methylmalonyl-CoA/ethylmalonyl-CoA epimerase
MTIAPLSIGQIAIAINDMPKAIAFYRDVLGLKFLFEAGPNLAFFACGDVRLMLTTLQGDSRDHRTSVIYYKVSDIQAATAPLQAQGIPLAQEPTMVAKMPDHHLWMAFLRDPDQNLIGLMAEVPF